jgi:hypothetical protein
MSYEYSGFDDCDLTRTIAREEGAEGSRKDRKDQTRLAVAEIR